MLDRATSCLGCLTKHSAVWNVTWPLCCATQAAALLLPALAVITHRNLLDSVSTGAVNTLLAVVARTLQPAGIDAIAAWLRTHLSSGASWQASWAMFHTLITYAI